MARLPDFKRNAPDLSGYAPGRAGDLALKIFCTPALSERRHPQQAQLAERARFHLRTAAWQRLATPAGTVQVYLFEPDGPPAGTVLVVHGWTSEASFMAALAEPVRRAGYRVVLFDLPAHGLSDGRTTNLMDCGRATASVGAAFAPLEAVICHSFGGMTALVAAEGPPRMPARFAFERMALLSSPNRLGDVTADFGRHFGLSHGGQRAFERRLERIGRRPMARFTTVDLLQAVNKPALIVHSRDDAAVPFACAEEIVAGVPHASLAAFDGLGHSNILFAPPVPRAIVTWLRDSASSPVSDLAMTGCGRQARG